MPTMAPTAIAGIDIARARWRHGLLICGRGLIGMEACMGHIISARLWPKFEWVSNRSRRKTRAASFLYGHGQAETARKIAVVSAYPANALSPALSKLAKVELSRKLKVLGHDARLMPARYVRPYPKARRTISVTRRRLPKSCSGRR